LEVGQAPVGDRVLKVIRSLPILSMRPTGQRQSGALILRLPL